MKNKTNDTDVSVIVVCYNEERNIGECLESLIGQDYGAGRYEVFIVDGDSKDGTIAIARDYEERYPFVRLIVEPRRGTAVARNTGVRAASYGLIAFLDADCVATPSWVRSLVETYMGARERDPTIAAVGGASFIPEGSKPFVKALKIALNTYLGSAGRVTGKCHPHERLVEDLPSLNVIYGKKLFDRLGVFNVSLRDEGEDADFSYRILKAGMRLLYSPLPVIYHKYRPDPLSWWRNMRRYGRARAALILGDPSMINFQYLGPFLLVLSLACTPLAMVWPVFLLPLAYFPLMLLAGCWEGLREGRIGLVLFIFSAYCLTHLGYGLGEIEGLARRLARGRRRSFACGRRG